MGPRAGLDDVEKRRFLPHRDSNSDPFAVQPVASRYTDSAILAAKIQVIGCRKCLTLNSVL
jgi:hypothetical protein